MKTGVVLLGVMIGMGIAQGQTTNPVSVTSLDMFNAIGQYYRVYYSPTNMDVSSLGLGKTGGPQTWDFTRVQTNGIFRFDYVDPSDGGHGADFSQAKYAERQTEEASNTALAWLYLNQVPGTGRRNYGFVNPANDPSEGQFNPPIIDFPDPLSYQANWTATTTWDFTVLGVAATINYTANATADAYGTVVLPQLGSLPCVRVNELDQYDTLVDLEGTGTPQPIETDYIRSYFFFSPGHGLVCQIVSQQSSSAAPGNDFALAAQFTRMFEFSMTGPSTGPGAVNDLSLTMANGVPFLSWSKSTNATSYRVEFTTNLGSTNNWQALTTTTSSYYLDMSTSNAAERFYRVVSLGQGQ